MIRYRRPAIRRRTIFYVSSKGDRVMTTSDEQDPAHAYAPKPVRGKDKDVQRDDVNNARGAATPGHRGGTTPVRISREEAENNLPLDPDPDDPASP
jgi:hypothetical protein